jgi:hypothetical protein
MSRPIEQTEWLNLVETAGPFLAGTVLQQIFPQGLEKIETPRRQRLRSAYEEWQEAVDETDDQLSDLHAAWVQMVFEEALEFDDEVFISDDKKPAYSPDGYDVEFSPDHVLRSQAGDNLFFVSVYTPGTRLDQPLSKDWVATPIERMKLLCRSHSVRVGLVTNGEQWALINAPADNTTGHTIWYARLWWQEPVTFKAFVSLLGVRRFFGPAEECIDQLLERSLTEHHEVTDTLGEQVRRAVEILVQALGRADEDRNGRLLQGVESADLYNAGLTVMMRLVFLLCAEERELLLLGDPVYDQHYAISTLRAKLREDADNYGVEVLERRYDAWSRLLSVFRAVYGGVEHDSLRLPAMGGSLFDPDRYAFLEGRGKGTSWKEEPASPLPIDNRTVMLLLRALQVLEHKGGARQLSYRGLDVEQIGHVYEGLLEYKVERLSVLTLGLMGSKNMARPTITLQQLNEWSAEGANKAGTNLAKLTGRSKSAMIRALNQDPVNDSLPHLVAACGGNEDLAKAILPYSALLQVDSWGTPLVYQAGSFAITLGAGRRESGSHYTPRSLTEPIVETTLRPILEAMNEEHTADKILTLKVCDPAMGSGAFLVEVCRQLASRLVEAWANAEESGRYVTGDGVVVEDLGEKEQLSSELSDRLVTARRLVAENCLYGVDKNPMAVELAKLSIWLVTLAKGRPFGFLDHKLKYGDSLVGLTRQQILAFTWAKDKLAQIDWLEQMLEKDLKEAFGWRDAIQGFGEFDYAEKKQVFEEAEDGLSNARLIGDLCIAAFFGANKDKAREEKRGQYSSKVAVWRENSANRQELEIIVQELRGGEKPVPPMHWEIEFPEVFVRENPGFDAMVGNPPFLGGLKIETAMGRSWRAFLVETVANGKRGVRGTADLCAYFFTRCYRLTRHSYGSIGFIATNTIAQGDTRMVGLAQIARENGMIFMAETSKPWPGIATVHFSIVCVTRSERILPPLLNGQPVEAIASDLTKGEANVLPEPRRLAANKSKSFQGSIVLGSGFILEPKEASALIQADSKYESVVFPYMSGIDLNSRIDQSPSRWVINFWDYPLDRTTAPEGYTGPVARDFTNCINRIEELVRPGREAKPPTNSWNRKVRSEWWLFGQYRWALQKATSELKYVLILAATSNTVAFARIKNQIVFSNGLYVFAFDGFDAFALLQSTLHDCWARSRSSTMKGDLRYTNSSVFETFPFPENWQADAVLEATGKTFYEFRTELMTQNREGLTKTYSRFNDPTNNQPGIVKLRELQAAMDRAVLNAYGWDDISINYDFLLDYEIDQETWGTKKKPYRYRWPEVVHDEVLARLLDLNQKRFEEEEESKAKKPTSNNQKGSVRKSVANPNQGELL